MLLFYILAALVVFQCVISLRGGVRYLAFVRRETDARRPLYMPFASIIVPCRGLDEGLCANLSALFVQHYPAYEIIFVSDRADDPALAVANELARGLSEQQPNVRARALVAGRATACGQKVHNLRAAVSDLDASSEVIVFVDTDARPRPDWLRALVAPLADDRIGATTGYRWFLPVRGNFASHLRAVWNASIASALGANEKRNFCWGGSTAIRRETFEHVGVCEQWRGTLSDDFALTRTLQFEGRGIRFVPDCLTATHEDCTLTELFEFTTRQLKITRVYAPHLWKIVLVSNLLFVIVFYGGLLLAATRAALGLTFDWPLALVSSIYLLGTWKALYRLRAVAIPLETYERQLQEGMWAHLLLWPLASALYLYNALAALFSRRIEWRGITYELKSPTETAIIKGDPASATNSAATTTTATTEIEERPSA